MTNQQLKAHCEDVIANPQDHLDWVVDMAKEALAALTQPAGPALKLPEVPPNALVALCEQMYDHRSTGVTVAHDVWQDCIEELRIDVLHTAPIEPICATGGADWTGNSLANDALIMLDRIDTSDSADDDRIEEVKRIVRLLAASPEES